MITISITSIFTTQVIPYSIGQIFFSKCYSEFLIDFIRLEFAKLFKWIQIIVQLRIQYKCFPVNIAKCLRIPYLQNSSEQLLLDVYIHLTIVATQRTNRNQVFSFFEHVLSWLSNVMSIGNIAFGKLFLEKQTTQLLQHGNHLMGKRMSLRHYVEISGYF